MKTPIPHELTIDQSRCHGQENCRECEKIMPGLMTHCNRYGHLLFGEWALRENSSKISQLAVACKPRAIMVRPL